ncbi:hypothetical protein JTB14_013360 [Gonioctena quinquepunctata]|nr:hypothetical protein JTB14_013360 [Gonioctena quinquepunctata]
MAAAAGDPKIAAANPLNNKANYTCCKTNQCSTIICVNCGAAFHKSCSERVKFTSVDDTRIKCCEVKITDDDENSQLTATKRENVLLQSLYWQAEKNTILRENNALLVEKIADLTYKLNALYQEHQNGTVSEHRKPLYIQQDIPTTNQQQLNLPEIELQKPQQNSSNPKKPEAEHWISGIQGDAEIFHEVKNRRKERVTPKILGTNEAQEEDEGFSEPTRITQNTETCLDNCITNAREDSEVILINMNMSDHMGIINKYKMKNDPHLKEETSIIEFRPFSNENISKCIFLLKEHKWEDLEALMDINEVNFA